MHVIDSLSAVRSSVHDESKTFVPTVFATEGRCNSDEVRDQRTIRRTIELSHGCDVRDGEDEQVGRRLWIDVFDRHGRLIAMNRRRGYIARRDLAKDAINQLN